MENLFVFAVANEKFGLFLSSLKSVLKYSSGYLVVKGVCRTLQLCRFKVSVLGLHTEDKTQLPTDDLPWAVVLTHDGAMSGLGTTPSFFVEGTWVLVDFFDDDKQEPYVLGGIPGIATQEKNSALGFFDPTSTYPTKLDVSDVNETARGSLTATNPTNRDAIRKTAVATADFDGFEIPTVGDNLSVSGSSGSSFDEPLVVNGTYNPVSYTHLTLPTICSV